MKHYELGQEVYLVAIEIFGGETRIIKGTVIGIKYGNNNILYNIKYTLNDVESRIELSSDVVCNSLGEAKSKIIKKYTEEILDLESKIVEIKALKEK